MNSLDLLKIVYYHSFREGNRVPSTTPQRHLRFYMKTTVRIVALSVVLAGAAAASVTPSSARTFVSHQSATASNPIPLCAPGLPTCQGR
jgi:hypothetical protein